MSTGVLKSATSKARCHSQEPAFSIGARKCTPERSETERERDTGKQWETEKERRTGKQWETERERDQEREGEGTTEREGGLAGATDSNPPPGAQGQ